VTSLDANNSRVFAHVSASPMNVSSALNDFVSASTSFPRRFIFVAQKLSSNVLCLARYSSLKASMKDAGVVVAEFAMT